MLRQVWLGIVVVVVIVPVVRTRRGWRIHWVSILVDSWSVVVTVVVVVVIVVGRVRRVSVVVGRVSWISIVIAGWWTGSVEYILVRRCVGVGVGIGVSSVSRIWILRYRWWTVVGPLSVDR